MNRSPPHLYNPHHVVSNSIHSRCVCGGGQCKVPHEVRIWRSIQAEVAEARPMEGYSSPSLCTFGHNAITDASACLNSLPHTITSESRANTSARSTSPTHCNGAVVVVVVSVTVAVAAAVVW